MRLTFPEAQHVDAPLTSGRTVIGSDAESDVRLQQAGICGRHVAIDLHPQRGISLLVLQAGAPVHINGRPVGEFSFLRAGDCVALGSLRMELVEQGPAALPDWAAGELPAADGQSATAASRVVLRGVSGKYYGRSIGLHGSPVVGSGPEADLRLDDAALPARHARIELWPNAVILRELAAGEGARVNGMTVRSGELRHGDQLVFDQHRFVLEAPGMPAPSPVRRPITGVHDAVPETPQVDHSDAAASGQQARHGHTVWWLVAAAALIAIILASLVY